MSQNRARDALIDTGVLAAAREPHVVRAIDLDDLPHETLTNVLDQVRADRSI